MQTTLTFATAQFAMAHTKSEDQLMPTTVEDVKTANGQDIFQTTPELNVF
jgi:hypothetical protein